MSRFENKLLNLTPIIWSNIPSLWLKNIVTLPGTLLCPGTQIDNTFKLKESGMDAVNTPVTFNSRSSGVNS